MMTPIEQIDIKIEPFEQNTGNILPTLHQIQHALSALLKSDQTTSIDINAMPFAPGEKQTLKDTLSTGEVTATLNALGKSHIYETQYAGVWWIEHYNSHEHSVGQFIEVTWIPELLKSQAEDVQAGLERLLATL